MSKTNTGLVEYAKAQLGKPYWYGTFGQAGTQSLYDYKKKQYPLHYTADRALKYKKQIAQNVKVHDCIGLIKGYLWCDDVNDMSPVYVVSQDKGANGMYDICKERGPISTLPELPGVLVFMDGHVGVYIGGGYVVEARGFYFGVVKTKLKDRPWKNWGKCPYIQYGEPAKKEPVKEEKKLVYNSNVKSLQKAAIADGFGSSLPSGADGYFGPECVTTFTKAVLKVCEVEGERIYRYKNLTKWVQKKLGFTGKELDGKYGDKTKKAVEKYQKKHNLKVDGEVGINTYKSFAKVK